MHYYYFFSINIYKLGLPYFFRSIIIIFIDGEKKEKRSIAETLELEFNPCVDLATDVLLELSVVLMARPFAVKYSLSESEMGWFLLAIQMIALDITWVIQK